MVPLNVIPKQPQLFMIILLSRFMVTFFLFRQHTVISRALVPGMLDLIT